MSNINPTSIKYSDYKINYFKYTDSALRSVVLCLSFILYTSNVLYVAASPRPLAVCPAPPALFRCAPSCPACPVPFRFSPSRTTHADPARLVPLCPVPFHPPNPRCLSHPSPPCHSPSRPDGRLFPPRLIVPVQSRYTTSRLVPPAACASLVSRLSRRVLSRDNGIRDDVRTRHDKQHHRQRFEQRAKAAIRWPSSLPHGLQIEEG